MTQIIDAKNGKLTPEMAFVAKSEKFSEQKLLRFIKSGQVIIPANKVHKKMNLQPIGIGSMLRTKINANIGASNFCADLKEELKKVDICKEAGADAIMDLSTSGDLRVFRKAIIEKSKMPVGTVPLYEIAKLYGASTFSLKDALKVIFDQAKDGVDFMTIHAGFRRKFLPLLEKRLMGTVSRGGGILRKWMLENGKENPLLSIYDEILDIFAAYDVAISLGDTLRPGSIIDAGDRAQIAELKFLGELTERAWAKNVQVMVEGPGHVPIMDIKKQVDLAKKYCHKAPFYVLGPLTLDSGAGFDHITGAIGGAIAAMHGASMLCYVTPAEHLSLPSIEDVKEGIIAFKIAARSADLAKKIPGSLEREREMSIHRKNFNWAKMRDLSMDKDKFNKYRFIRGYKGIACSMCGDDFCPMNTKS